MNVLGINAYHADAAACLVRDGRLIAAIAEERLGERLKHHAGFPARAISRVLEIGGIGIRDVDFVAVGHDPAANLSAKLRHAVSKPFGSIGAARISLLRRSRIKALVRVVSEKCGFPLDECGFEVVHVEHHLAHLASAYYCSGFEEAAVFSFDASGDFVSTMYGRGSGRDIEVLKRIHLPHSLGYFYTALCQFIGFDRYGEEHKVMGLAAYGDPVYAPLLEDVLIGESRGGFSLNPDYFSGLLTRSHAELVNDEGEIVIPPLYSEALVDVLGPPRTRGSEITRRDRDVAASCQAHFEAVTLHCLKWLHHQVRTDVLAMAGGCALNGVVNARILRDTPFKRTYIQSAAGDDGTALGAALYVSRAKGVNSSSPALARAAWGTEYSHAQIEQVLRDSGASHRKLDTGVLLSYVAQQLSIGMIVGWYQGRSEWGPRALGHRSILAHPGWPNMKSIINRRVKRREAFRPFAPSILAERVPDYFEQNVQSPFMMHVVRIREEKRRELAAVTHEDFTGRLHTVSRAQNPLYYDLISTFECLTGTPVLLNTSFNENEPIVETPGQALTCFRRNSLDLLCIGSFVVWKNPNSAPGEPLE